MFNPSQKVVEQVDRDIRVQRLELARPHSSGSLSQP
jgi:hypothetical protein